MVIASKRYVEIQGFLCVMLGYLQLWHMYKGRDFSKKEEAMFALTLLYSSIKRYRFRISVKYLSNETGSNTVQAGRNETSGFE